MTATQIAQSLEDEVEKMEIRIEQMLQIAAILRGKKP
jgi:hypothetical protein